MIVSNPAKAPQWRDEIRAAWAVPYVRAGLVATIIIALGSLTPAYLPQASPVWPILRSIGLAGQIGRVAGTILTVCGVFLLVDAWFRLRHGVYARLKPLIVIGIWALPFLVSPPIFSHDVYSYGAQGWMIHNGQNPYDGGPGLVPGPFSDYTPWVWRYTAAPYGPVALQIARAIVELSHGLPWLAALLMRLPAVIGVILVVTLLPRIAQRTGADVRQVVWFACLNPLLVIDYIGGAHNDAWMMGLVVTGLWLATRVRWWPAGAVLIGVAAAMKQPAIIVAVFLPWLTQGFSSWRDRSAVWPALGRSFLSGMIAVAVFVAASFSTGLGFGWVDAVSVPGSVGSIAPAYLIGQLVQWLVGPGSTAAVVIVNRVVLVAGLVFIAWITIKDGGSKPWKALSWSLLALAFSLAALHPWYLLWGGLLLPLSRTRRNVPWPAVLVVILMLCYAAMNVGDRNGTFAIIVAALAVLVWLAHLAIYHHFGSVVMTWWRGLLGRRPHQADLVEESARDDRDLPTQT
ncbi:MAG: polyprenol phosphomannose-dependent alpha 1,6 mannosyltransferase MptB [Propionibacteriaceae bacterium]|jgi:alpha-1,6-mannosyltransferase|nr:polyprenol phosphomannose-dependent alpha 1,6 mannosyltransferase MptB [Propionibacteriaceae bacterium]